jgi:hypothetical protein
MSGLKPFAEPIEYRASPKSAQHQAAQGSHLENLMDYGSLIFNLASTFANGDPNFGELIRVQSVGANYSLEGL